MKPKLIRPGPNTPSNKITLKLIIISATGIQNQSGWYSPSERESQSRPENNIITEEKREIGVLQEV